LLLLAEEELAEAGAAVVLEDLPVHVFALVPGGSFHHDFPGGLRCGGRDRSRPFLTRGRSEIREDLLQLLVRRRVPDRYPADAQWHWRSSLGPCVADWLEGLGKQPPCQ